MNYICRITLFVITICCALPVTAADPFAGLAERSYDAPIISLLRDENTYQSAVQLFQELPKEDQKQNLITLFRMYGNDEQIYVSSVERNRSFLLEEPIADNLIRIAYDLQLQPDSALRKVFFDIPGKRDSSEGMFCRFLKHFNVSPDHICTWFPADDPRQNRAYMLEFLNYLHPDYVYRLANNEVDPADYYYHQNLLTVCDRIGFNDWNAVNCLSRMIIKGTVDKVTAATLKSFFGRHGVDFEDSRDYKIERHRIESFNGLIRKYDNQSDDKKLLEVLQFLVENPGICSLEEPFQNCFVFLQQIFRRRGLRFIPTNEQFCAYVSGLHLRYPDATAEVWDSGKAFLAVRAFLNICCMFSDAEFLQARGALIREPRFSIFIERSRTALEKYVEQYPATRKAVKKVHRLERLILYEMKCRATNNDMIRRLLGEHLKGTLFEMLLEQSRKHAWLDSPLQ